MALSPLFTPVSFNDLPGWREDDLAPAFAAFRRSATRVLAKPYKTGSLGVEFSAFGEVYREALLTDGVDASSARGFFEEHFAPARVDAVLNHTPTPDPSPQGGGGLGGGVSESPSPLWGGVRGGGNSRPEGLVTGFYEPEVDASPTRTATFTVPLLARPSDLIDIDDTNRPSGMDPYFAFARATPSSPVEYHDRAAISSGALDRQGLELAWLASKVDAFFIHVQGAARLRMTDGSLRRVTYAAKTGHPFTAIGRELANAGKIPLERVTMQSIRGWLAAHPDRVDDILWRNRSYIFFRDAEVSDPALGPIAAAKVPLTPGRSVAVDRLLHTFGTPFYIDAPTLTAFDGKPFRRLMIAQDTGSAIVGPARGDLFAGSGDAAGEIAGVVRNAATFYALLPKPLMGMTP